MHPGTFVSQVTSILATAIHNQNMHSNYSRMVAEFNVSVKTKVWNSETYISWSQCDGLNYAEFTLLLTPL